MKIKKVVNLFIEEDSARFSGWTQLIAKTKDGKEYIITGSYCGGIPESHWSEIGKNNTSPANTGEGKIK